MNMYHISPYLAVSMAMARVDYMCTAQRVFSRHGKKASLCTKSRLYFYDMIDSSNIGDVVSCTARRLGVACTARVA